MLARLTAVSALLAAASARVHHLVIENDPRYVFSIESFGFLDTGKVDLTVSNIKVEPAGANHTLGFVIYPSGNSEQDIYSYINWLTDNKRCALEVAQSNALPIDLSNPKDWTSFTTPAEVTGAGWYDLLFAHCSPVGGSTSVSFTLDVTFVNPGPNYLSAGEMPLPAMYGVMTVLFAAAVVVWVRYLRRNKPETTRVHHLMTLLLAVKVATLLFEAVMYHYVAVTGHNSAWNVMFYIFSFLKGLLMAVVTLLVGAGFSILKPFLTEKDKKILLIAVALQLLTNTAIVMTDELAPGSITFSAWVDVLHIADVIASCAVLVPLATTTRTLKRAVEAGAAHAGEDAKTAETLQRLGQFQSFYLMTLGYLYVTRVLLYILAQGLPYDATWIVPFSDEAATLAYYVVTGFRFRPMAENRYLRVSADEDGSGDVELAERTGRATGAAMGSVAGSAPTVQTIAAAPRTRIEVVEGSEESSGSSSSSSAATAPAPAAAPAAAPRTAVAPKGAHVVGDEFDDDDFGLDDDLDGEEEKVPLKPVAQLKQVRKAEDR